MREERWLHVEPLQVAKDEWRRDSPHTEEGNTNFPELNHKLDSSRATPSRPGDKSSKVTNTNKIVGEDEWSALAQMSGSLKDLLKSSLKCSRIKRED
jgi:hypothetical protein